MAGNGLRQKIGSFLTRLFPNGYHAELDQLRAEVDRLRGELQTAGATNSASVRQERETLRTDSERPEDRDVKMLKKETEILRNELQENIAAIHRLEILTLSQRIDLLNAFGKALPPTVPGRTRKSFKPRGLSFGIITNGKRPEPLERLFGSIRAQKLPAHTYEIMVAGCVEQLSGREGIRTFPMVEAAEQGRLGAMRNVLAKEAHFNTFVSLDDDFLLHPDWAKAVLEISGNFDIATGIILNPDISRYCDWVNVIENYTFLRSYQEYFDKCQYMTGGYGIYKDYIFLEHSWNDDLGFYQGEDVSFSRRLFDAGYQLKFIAKAVVMHDDDRYRQKGYGVIRLKSAQELLQAPDLQLRIEKLCPRTLS